ncbi:MAG: CidA/LrgA family protein [Clostridiaceae bacterium]|nr:CidA/LrgA family protein [Clostridiaceae bacterium]
MEFIFSIAILLGFTFLGELLHVLLPLPIPAAIYGLLLLFLALNFKLVSVKKVKKTAGFFISIMSILFVAPVVNLMDSWQIVADNIIQIIVIVVLSTIIVFAISGNVTKLMLKGKESKNE